MNALYFQTASQHTSVHTELPRTPSDGYVWLDFARDEVTSAPDAWQQQIATLTGTQIDEFHLMDILNAQHPSAFDLTDDYQILIFRKLITVPTHASAAEASTQALSPSQLHTTPVSLILTERALISVRDADSPVFDGLVSKFKQFSRSSNTTDAPSKQKGIPTSPIDLCLKLLNGVIDKYLDVRAPLTTQIEHWQNALLQDKKRFTQWSQLLRESVALQKLESLCEEQIDALQEFRDDFIDNQFDAQFSSRNEPIPSTLTPQQKPHRRDLLLVRLNDLIEHASRVQKHAARLEYALQSAVDLHFSASTNQTNETMRFLAILTAIFAPLTLLTGVYGMNFDAIPGLHNPRGFWFLLASMVLTTLILLYYFHRNRIVNRSEKSIAQLLSGDEQA